MIRMERLSYLFIIGQGLCVVDAFSDKDDKKTDAEQDEAAIAEARSEAEERRKEKHRKMEEEREKMRQDIRDKVVFSARCNIYISRLFYDASARLSVCL